jgi:phosphoribosylanthranilate isomerase
VLKTVKVGARDDLSELDRYRPAAFLLDSPARWSEGGEARAPISWALAREAAGRGRIVLAAGLTADNVGEAIRAARPWGVDVNSGVEARPGRKDPAKLRGFVRAVRAADLGDPDG